jgi:hypothetical protein
MKPLHLPRATALWVLLAFTSIILPRHARADEAAPFQVRVVSVALEGASLDYVDLGLRIGVVSSRDLTIRRLLFTDSFVEDMPIWLRPLEGRWRAAAGRELLIGDTLHVRVYVRDLRKAAPLAAAIEQGVLRVRTIAEVRFETPWLGRLFLRGPYQTGVVEATTEVPLPGNLPRPMLGILAGVSNGIRSLSGSVLGTLTRSMPAQREMPDAFARTVATITTGYAFLNASGSRTDYSQASLAFWWAERFLCTTMEALQPWRFDLRQASELQVGGARLLPERIRIDMPGMRPIVVDAGVLARQLPPPRERRVYTDANGSPRRIRLAERDVPSNVVCLRFEHAPAMSPPRLASSAAQEVGAFALEGSAPIVVSTLVEGDAGDLRLVRPLDRTSYGSPLFSAGGVCGIVVSGTTALDTSAIAAAAALAIRVPGRAVS